jgi:hypothetical protein
MQQAIKPKICAPLPQSPKPRFSKLTELARQGRLRIARQELPGKDSKTAESRQGRLNCSQSAPRRDCPSSRWLTRQFLPGYSQPRLTALFPILSKASSKALI